MVSQLVLDCNCAVCNKSYVARMLNMIVHFSDLDGTNGQLHETRKGLICLIFGYCCVVLLRQFGFALSLTLDFQSGSRSLIVDFLNMGLCISMTVSLVSPLT